MLLSHVILSLVLCFVPSTLAALATTTSYSDGLEGACGCGTSSGAFVWQHWVGPDIYTAAGSPAIFAPLGGTRTWCGGGCGTCFNLTNQGYAPPGQGTGAGAGQTITVMVTNLCPYAGNERWCPPKGEANSYGYDAHFDIMKGAGLVQGKGFQNLGWDNPVVSYEQIPCPAAAKADYQQCYCATHTS